VLPIKSRGSSVMVLCFFEVNQPILRYKKRIKQEMPLYIKLETRLTRKLVGLTDKNDLIVFGFDIYYWYWRKLLIYGETERACAAMKMLNASLFSSSIFIYLSMSLHTSSPSFTHKMHHHLHLKPYKYPEMNNLPNTIPFE
jgi:hypothetical protein